MKTLINEALWITLYLPLTAFLAHMFVLAIIGKQLAVQINGGTVALTTFTLTYATILLLYFLNKLRTLLKE